jgi:hypothetical protein
MRTPPYSVIPHQSVEDGEQLPHARHQCHLLGFAGGEEAFIELPNDGVVSGGDQSSHVEGGPHRSPASPYLPLAAALAGVAVEGGDTDQGAHSLVGELSQFGQFGKQSARKYRTDTGNTLEKSFVLLEDAAPLDGFIEVTVRAGELFLEPLDVRPDALSERRGSHLETVVFGGEHREDLAPPGEYVLQKLGFLVGDDARGGTDGGGEAGEDERVDAVSLGEASRGLGEVASLAGIDDGHCDPGGCDGGGGEALVATGGLQNDQLGARPRLRQAREKFIHAFLIVGEREGLSAVGRVRWQKAHLEGPLGDVDAYYMADGVGIAQAISPFRWRRPGLADSGLLMGRAEAPATVRAPPKGRARRRVLSCGLSDEHGPRRNRSVAPSLAAL